MNVSLDERRLGGLRWIVLRGPDREAFRALGEHTRDEIAAASDAATWRGIPAEDPDPAWFLRVLAGASLPDGVRVDPAPGHPATTLCTFIADLTAGEAVIAARDDQPVAIPLGDLAEGNPHRQRQLVSTGD